MKFKIILLVLGYCFNLVAPYNNQGGYQQGVYQPPNYPQNPGPIYPAHRQYGHQQAVNYVAAPETQYLQEIKSEQQNQDTVQRRVEAHADASFVDQPPQVYSERPSHHLPSPALERNYDVYAPAYASEYLQDRQRGPRNQHRSLPVQEHYRKGFEYPQWQSGYKAVPQTEYYGSNYEQQNKPVQYAQPQDKPVDVEISPISESKAEGLRQNEYYGNHYEQRNNYKPHVQYVSQPHKNEAMSNTETHPSKPEIVFNGISNSHERQHAYNPTAQYKEQVKHEDTSMGSERTPVIKQHENYGSPYEHQNTYNTPLHYTHAQQAVAIASSDLGPKTHATVLNKYDNSYELQNAFNTPQRLAQPHPVEPVEPSSISETKITVVKQNEGTPYEHQNTYNPVVQHLLNNVEHPHQAKPFEPSTVSETKIQRVQQHNEYYENPYEHQNDYNTTVHTQPLQSKPAEEPSEMTKVLQKQNEFYGNHYMQNYGHDVPINYATQPQQAVAVASVSVPKTQEHPQNKYYENTYEQKNDYHTPVQHVQQKVPQETNAVAEASSGFLETKTQHSYDQQNAFNAPVHYIAKPQKVQAQASAFSETKTPEKHYSKPEVLDYLGSTPQKGRYLIIHQNGTVENVNVIDDNLLGNSHLKSSDLRKETTKVPVENKIVPHPLNNDDHNKNPSKPIHNINSVSKPIVSKEIKPTTLPITNIKNHHGPIKTNYNNYSEASIQSPELLNYNYPSISDLKQNPIEKHNNNEYYPNNWENHNIYPLNENKPIIEQKPNVNINNDAWYNNKETNPTKPLSDAQFQPNFKPNNLYTTEAIAINNNRKPAYEGHWNSINNEGYNYNPLENILFNSTSYAQNNFDDATKSPIKDPAPVAYYAKDADALNPLHEPATTTALPSDSQNIPKKPDGINTLTFASPLSSDILDSFAQNPMPDNTSSNIQNYSGAGISSTEKFKDDVIAEAVALTQPNKINHEHPTVGDVYYKNGEIVNVSITDLQDTIIENDDDDDDDDDGDEQSLVEKITQYINTSPITIKGNINFPKDAKNKVHKEDQTTKSPEKDKTDVTPKEKKPTLPHAEDKIKVSHVEPHPTESVTDADSVTHPEDKKNKASKEAQPTKDVVVTKDATTKKPLGENEVVVDEAFWDAVYSSNETGGFNDLFIFNVKVDAPVFEKNSRSFVLANGSYVEEIEEIYWEHKDDAYPKEMKFTRITKNHSPESVHSGKNKINSPKKHET